MFLAVKFILLNKGKIFGNLWHFYLCGGLIEREVNSA